MNGIRQRRRGFVTTFYSYKGGVGRTFLLANVAWLLARWGRKVLCLDWDLEAPGLQRFLAPFAARRQGVLEILCGFGSSNPLPWRDCVEDVNGPWSGTGCLHLIGAGLRDEAYIQSLYTLDWQALSDRGLESYLETLREEWVSPGQYDHVLIDSRTGITDVGGICAAQLPDLLVLTFTATFQSLEGAIEVADRAERSRKRMPIDRGGFNVLPVPCRIHVGEEDRLEQEWMERFAEDLAPLFKPWRDTAVKAREYLPYLRVKEQARWSFGEQIPVQVEDADDPSRISYALANIAALLDQRLHDSGMIARERNAYVRQSAEAAGDETNKRISEYDLFISYPSESREAALTLAGRLEKQGLKPFIDVAGAPLGSDWRRTLYTARESINTFAVLVSAATIEGRPQWDEILHILRRKDESNVQVIPIFLDRESFSAAPARLTRLFGLNAEPDDGLDQAAGKIAVQLLQQRIAISRETGDQCLELDALTNLGSTLADMGDLERAATQYLEALALSNSAGNEERELSALRGLSDVYVAQGQLLEAQRYRERALGISSASDHLSGEGADLGRLGFIHQSLGQVDKATQCHTRALEAYRRSGDSQGVAAELNQLGNLYHQAGELEPARKLFEEARTISSGSRDRQGEISALMAIGKVHVDLGEYQEAVYSFEAALAITRESDVRFMEVSLLSNLGKTYAVLGDHAGALAVLEDALSIARRIGDRSNECSVLGNLGLTYAALGDSEKAIDAYEKALAITREIGDLRGESTQIFNLAGIYEKANEKEKARFFWQRAISAAERLGDSRMVQSATKSLERIADKRRMAGFDCFISHNSSDKPAVRALTRQLEAQGVRCWLDEEQLRPGLPWQDLLEQGIWSAGSVAVCVGTDGRGPWEYEEMQAALILAISNHRPVIPVLLPGASIPPELPLFLSSRTWVDLRGGLAGQPFLNLIWGITGERPALVRIPGAATEIGSDFYDASASETTLIPSEALFIEEVLELLYYHPTLILLAQTHRDLGGSLTVLRKRAQERYGTDRVLHLAPPRDPQASEAEFFATLGMRAGMDPVPRTAGAFESALETRLAAKERLFLLISGLADCSEKWRERLAGSLRGLSDFHGEALRLVLVGGEGLVRLKYAQGALSLLSHSEPRHWPEWTTGDVIDQARRGSPPLDLEPKDALALLTASGGHPRLIFEALHCRRRGRPLAECLAGLARSGLIEAQFNALAQDPTQRQALADSLAQSDLGPWRVWVGNPLLRRLYWLNLLRPDGSLGQERLVWRCPAVVEIGLRVVG